MHHYCQNTLARATFFGHVRIVRCTTFKCQFWGVRHDDIKNSVLKIKKGSLHAGHYRLVK